MAATKTDVSTVEIIALSAINVVDDFNPRKEFDEDALDGLATQIKTFGVIQPILVTPAETPGEYDLVAGERRVRASKLAGKTEIPALIRPADSEAATLALMENVSRVNLNPIEEAAGFQGVLDALKCSRKELAAKLGKAPSSITESLALLDLPVNCQKLLADRKLPPASARFLRKINKQSADFTAHIGDLLADPKLELDTTNPEHQAHRLMQLVADRVGEKVADLPILTCCVSEGYELVRGEAPIVWPEGGDELLARVDEIRRTEYSSVHFDSSVWEAAEAFGCVLEVDGRTYLTDAGFAMTQLEEWAKRKEQSRRDRLAVDAKAAGVSPSGDADDEASPEERAKAVRRAERAAKEQKRSSAIDFNTQLGVNMVKKLGAVKVTTDTIKLLAFLILADNDDLPGAGLALCDPTMRTVENIERKNGNTTTKIEYASSGDALEAVRTRIGAAKSSEEVLAHLFSALVSGEYADTAALLSSDYRSWSHRTLRGFDSPYSKPSPADYALAKVAVTVLPPAEAKALREKIAKAKAKDAPKKPTPRKTPAKKPAAS